MSDFDPYQHFGFLTHRVARLMDLLVSPELKSRGHTFPASCIGILADLWSEDGVTQKDLGSSMIKNKSSVNKMLQALESDGLIEKKDDPYDRRNKLIFLTDKGLEFKSMLEYKSSSNESELLNHHSIEEIETAKRVLKTIYLKMKEKVKTIAQQ